MSHVTARVVAAIAVAVTVSLAGCAAVRKTRPLDMSAAEHEEAARDAMARRHPALAAAHAEAARALYAAERRACEGVAPGDRSPGVSGLEVVRVSRLERPFKSAEVIEGAAVVVAANGRSFEALERLIGCRSARADVTRDALDPLAVAETTVRVYREDGDAVVVQLRSRSPERAREIYRRVARQLGERAGPGDADAPDRGDAPGAGPAGDGGEGDPRTHGPGPSGPLGPGGFPPIDGSGPRRGP